MIISISSLGVLLALALTTVASAAEANFSFSLNGQRQIFVTRSGKSVSAAPTKNNPRSPYFVDKQLSTWLLGVDQSIVLSKNAFPTGAYQAVYVITRSPSARSNPNGYCGAGHEDYLLLVGLDSNRLKLLDKILLQSCLKSISLAGDNGDDLETLLLVEGSPPHVALSWLAHPQYGDDKKIIRVKEGKLVLH